MEEQPTFWETDQYSPSGYTTPENDETLQNAPSNPTELAHQQTGNVLSGAVDTIIA